MFKKILLFLSKFSLPKNLFITRIFTLMLCLCLFISLFHFQNVFSLHGISSILYTNFKLWINNFISAINILYQYLDTLTILQESSLLHILLFLILFLTVTNILAVLFGNEILKVLKLEVRYPKLAVFFRLRSQLQRYYLIWNVSMLFIVCIFGIAINLLLLTVK